MAMLSAKPFWIILNPAPPVHTPECSVSSLVMFLFSQPAHLLLPGCWWGARWGGWSGPGPEEGRNGLLACVTWTCWDILGFRPHRKLGMVTEWITWKQQDRFKCDVWLHDKNNCNFKMLEMLLFSFTKTVFRTTSDRGSHLKLLDY